MISSETAFGWSFCLDERGYSHALATRLCHPGRASGFSISASAQSPGSMGLSNRRFSLSAALGGRPSVRSPIYSWVNLSVPLTTVLAAPLARIETVLRTAYFLRSGRSRDQHNENNCH